jgi:hypothetical protein
MPSPRKLQVQRPAACEETPEGSDKFRDEYEVAVIT